ncbi:MAG: kinase, partial [Gemmataceae bacterium]
SHPSVRESLKYLGIDRGVELHHDGDLPARSGMGTSSAFTISLLHALHALRGEMVTKSQLVREALYLEQEVLGETVGSQDQVLAAHGGLRHVKFLPTGEIASDPLVLPVQRVEELQSHLMLFYTGIVRTSGDVAKSYVVDLEARRRQLRIMKELVDESIDILVSGMDIRSFGDLLHEAWQAKRSLSAQVSNPEVDHLYATARQAGALGGKLTGAGGGGFLLLFVEPNRQADVRLALEGRIEVPFRFESAGSQIIFYETQGDYAAADLARRTRQPIPFRELSLPGVTAEAS